MKAIQPNEWYGIGDIKNLNLGKVLATEYRIKQMIDAGLVKGNTIGKDQGKRYFVKGESLIKFLAAWEDGSFKK